MIGHDRVGATAAVYRFRFKSYNQYPSIAGFRLTLPSTALNVDTATYTLTCNVGCTAVASTPAFSANAAGAANSVLTFTDVFSVAAGIAAGTTIEVDITGFTNPSTETVYDVFYEVIHTASAVTTAIDKF